MAEFCVKCDRKIGIWEDAALYLKDEKPMCSQCAKPITEYFESLPKTNAEESAVLEEKLMGICENTYSENIAMLIMEEFQKRRRYMGLLTEEEKETSNRRKEELEKKVKTLPMTTTQSFEGYKIQEYIEVICEEIIFKNSFWNRLAATLEDVGNTFSFKETEMTGASELIAKARQYVVEKFKRKAANLGANAVVGVEFESSFGSDVVRVAISGTAVVISKID